MKVTRIINKLNVIGYIWMPHTMCAYSYTPNNHDLENIREFGDGTITREGVQDWLDKNAGDFSQIVDFSADFGDDEFVSDWSDEESMFTFNDCMYGSEE